MAHRVKSDQNPSRVWWPAGSQSPCNFPEGLEPTCPKHFHVSQNLHCRTDLHNAQHGLKWQERVRKYPTIPLIWWPNHLQFCVIFFSTSQGPNPKCPASYQFFLNSWRTKEIQFICKRCPFLCGSLVGDFIDKEAKDRVQYFTLMVETPSGYQREKDLWARKWLNVKTRMLCIFAMSGMLFVHPWRYIFCLHLTFAQNSVKHLELKKIQRSSNVVRNASLEGRVPSTTWWTNTQLNIAEVRWEAALKLRVWFCCARGKQEGTVFVLYQLTLTFGSYANLHEIREVISLNFWWRTQNREQ